MSETGEETREELKSCEAKLRAFMANSFHGIVVADAKGTILFANQAAAAIFGCKPEELLGERCGFPLEADKATELTVRSRDGRTVAVEMWGMATEWDGAQAILAQLHDITERRQKELELRKLYRAVRESPSIVLITDARGAIEFVNPKFTAVTGYTFAEVAGKNPRILKSGQVSPEVYRELWETILAGREWRGEMVNRRKDGELYWEFAAISPVRDTEGKITNFIAVTEDITERKQAEERLRRSEQQLAEAQRLARLGSWEWDIGADKLAASAELYRIFGVPPEEFDASYAGVMAVVHPDDRARYEGIIRNTIAEKSSYDNYHRIVRPDGTVRILHSRGAVRVDETGTPESLFGTCEDVTEHKLAEEALRESEERYRSLVELAPDAIIIHKDGFFVYANAAALRLYGASTFDQLRDKHILDLIHPDDREVVRARMKQVQRGERLPSREIRMLRLDGREVPVEATGSLISYRGTPAVQAIIRDISRRKRSEEALRESEAKFSKAFQAVPALLSISSLVDGRYVEVNEAFEKTLGFRRDEVIGRTVLELGIWENPDDRERMIGMLREGTGVRDFETRLRGKSGVVIDGALSAEIINFEGRECLLAITRDITEIKQAEEERARLAAIVESSDDAIISKTLDGVVATWNRGAEKIYGYSAQEMKGRRITVLSPPDRTDEVSQILERIKRGEHVVHFETVRVTKDGGNIHASLSISPIVDTAGRIIGASEIARDITERKRSEEALRESEEKFAKIFNAAPVGITISALADGRFVDINETGERLSGYRRDEVIGRSALEFDIWNDPLERAEVIEELMKCGEVRDREMTMKDKGGNLFVGLLSAEVIEIRGEKYMLGLVSDITERKQAEEALRESEQRFRTLAAATSEGIVVTEHGRILDANERLTQILGYDQGELIGLEVAALLPPEERDRVMSNILLGRESQIEHEVLRKDGSRRIVEARGRTIDQHGRQLRITAIRDITERKRAEAEIEMLNTDLAARAVELEAANRELEAFSYSVSHDLRRPLTTINGYCQIIQETCGATLDEQCLGYLREINDGTLRMNQLIDALLRFSSMTRVELHRETVDLSGMAEAVAAELALAEPERRVTFRIAEGIEVTGDANLLRLVMENLLGNAWKYTSQREVGVIEFGVAEIDGKPACFVRDNGTGFAMAEAEKLFIPFQRLSGAGEFKGHGIGLATVERIIRRHGGRIWAEGALWEGATFYFTLPT